MFDFIFGWSKAARCKKLIRKVQCRLNLLKNKRCCIVKQLRDDVGQLLKHGHYQSAFERVEQIFKDECILTVYDLLAQFCQFIIFNLSYIRRHKDCPNDINEAISSLIFASARFGDLPELRLLRKLFGKRYGPRFEATAIELLPGNLVNKQMTENLSVKFVRNEVKYKLLDEIAKSVLQTGPLALEFSSEQHQQQASKNNDDQGVQNGREAESSQIGTEESRVDVNSNTLEPERNLVVDITSGENASDSDSFSVVQEPRTIADGVGADSSPRNSSTEVSEEMVYLDDIEELQRPMTKGENEQDQRAFMFKSSVVIPRTEKCKDGCFEDTKTEHYESSSWDEQEMPRRYRKTRKVSGKRSRKRSVSLENTIGIKDTEFALYYNQKPNHKERSKTSTPKTKILPLEEENVENEVYYLIRPENLLLARRIWKLEREGIRGWDIADGSSVCTSCSMEASSPWARKEMPGYSRAMTMPCERTKERPDDADAVLRSNSFPVEPSSPHVHPKLPDYDELTAKFMALKKAHLQNKNQN